MLVKVDTYAVKCIEEILKRGNNAVVRRYKDGVVVSEQLQKVKYRSVPIEGQKDNGSQS